MTRPANPELVAALLRSASDLIAERGPDGVTLKEVASRLRVTTTTVHYYFGDRDGLMAAVRTGALADLSAALAAAVVCDGPAAVQLRAVARAFVGWAQPAHHRYALAFALTSSVGANGGELPGGSADLHRILHTSLQAILERGRRRGELTLDDADLQASLALCWLAGVAVVDPAPEAWPRLQAHPEALLDATLSAFFVPLTPAASVASPEGEPLAAVAELALRRSAGARELADDELDQVAAAGVDERILRDAGPGPL